MARILSHLSQNENTRPRFDISSPDTKSAMPFPGRDSPKNLHVFRGEGSSAEETVVGKWVQQVKSSTIDSPIGQHVSKLLLNLRSRSNEGIPAAHSGERQEETDKKEVEGWGAEKSHFSEQHCTSQAETTPPGDQLTSRLPFRSEWNENLRGTNRQSQQLQGDGKRSSIMNGIEMSVRPQRQEKLGTV